MQVKEKNFYGLAYDRIFKAVALNKEHDYRFLNGILSDILEEPVTVIKAHEHIKERLKILDILVKTENNEVINIELDNAFSEYVKERNLMYYLSSLLREFIKEKEYKKAKRIIQINLNFDKVREKPKEHIKFYNTTLNEVCCNEFEIINVNPLTYKRLCYDKNTSENIDHIFLVCLVSDEKELKKLSCVDEVVKEVSNKVFDLNEDEMIKDQIEREKDAEIVYRNSTTGARKDGIKEEK